MFPFVRNASIFMGADKAWVNMWLWRADGYGPFSVSAAGIGTTQRVNDGVLKAVAGCSDGAWQVLFTQPFQPADHRDHVPLQSGTTWQAPLALWQGANAERGGFKSVCPTWTDVDIGARPGGGRRSTKAPTWTRSRPAAGGLLEELARHLVCFVRRICDRPVPEGFYRQVAEALREVVKDDRVRLRDALDVFIA